MTASMPCIGKPRLGGSIETMVLDRLTNMRIKKAYDFLYYCYYCMMGKSDNYPGEGRASTLLSLVESTYITSIYLWIKTFFGPFPLNGPIIFSGCFFIIVGNVVLHDYYFNRTGRDKQIIKNYSDLSRRKKWILGIIALFISIGSIICIVASGIITGIIDENNKN